MASVPSFGALLLVAMACCVSILAQGQPTVTVAPAPATAAPTTPALGTAAATAAPAGGSSSAGSGSNSASAESSSSKSSEETTKTPAGEPAPGAPPAPAPKATNLRPMTNAALPDPNVGVEMTNNADYRNQLPMKGSQLPSGRGLGTSTLAAGITVAVVAVTGFLVGVCIVVIKKLKLNPPVFLDA